MTRTNSPDSFEERLTRLIGVPFVSKGRALETGLDCWGLVMLASRELFGRELPDYPGYSDARNLCDVAPLFEARTGWELRPPGGERPGDVIVLRIVGHATHAGIVVKRGQMLHTMLYCNSGIEGYGATKWKARVEGFYSWQPR